MNLITKPIRVIHFPQVGNPFSFVVNVANEREAFLVKTTLANQHLFLLEQDIIEDYSNVIIIEMFENGDWEDYYNEEEQMNFDEFSSTYLEDENLELNTI